MAGSEVEIAGSEVEVAGGEVRGGEGRRPVVSWKMGRVL